MQLTLSRCISYCINECLLTEPSSLRTTKMSRCFKCHSFFGLFLLVADFYCCFFYQSLFSFWWCLAWSLLYISFSCRHHNYQSIRGPSNIFSFSRCTTTQVHFYWLFLPCACKLLSGFGYHWRNQWDL